MTRSEIGALTAERLRRALDVELAKLAEREQIDMSREAVSRRIRECADMSSLCLELAAGARAKP